MKNWIRVIFALNGKLDAMTYSIDGQVDRLATLTAPTTMELFDNIIRLNDQKVRLINLRVLHDSMKNALSDTEYRIIALSARGRSFGEIATELGMQKAAVYRMYMKAISRLTRLLGSYGYDANKFDEDYSDMALVTRTYKKISGSSKASA